MTEAVTVALVAGGLGLAAGLVLGRWLTRLRHRYRDEEHLPPRSFRWVAPVALLGVCSWAVGDGARWWESLACGAGSGFVHLVLALVNPAGLGVGDVKLAVTLGMLAGWFGWPQAVLAFFAALVVGLVHGSVVALATRGGRRTAFAFGPSMVVGAGAVVLLVGPAAL